MLLKVTSIDVCKTVYYAYMSTLLLCCSNCSMQDMQLNRNRCTKVKQVRLDNVQKKFSQKHPLPLEHFPASTTKSISFVLCQNISKYIYVHQFIGQVAFALALDPHNDNIVRIQTDIILKPISWAQGTLNQIFPLITQHQTILQSKPLSL